MDLPRRLLREAGGGAVAVAVAVAAVAVAAAAAAAAAVKAVAKAEAAVAARGEGARGGRVAPARLARCRAQPSRAPLPSPRRRAASRPC